MSMTNNGAPLGTDGIKALASTDSWQSPSEYVDPTTGKTWRADTLEDLLALLEQNNVKLFDHDAMRAANKTTAPKGNRAGQAPNGEDNAQWDRLLIQLQHYPDPEKAREIIIGALANPDVSITRNVGKDRMATKSMKGRRAVLAHEVHHDDERGPHFMAQVHTVALGPDGHISQKWSFHRGEDMKAMVAQINEALAENGLAPILFRQRDETGTSVAERKAQLDAQQSEEYREAAEKGELPPLLDETEADTIADAMPTSAKKENLRQAAQLAGAQAASLYAQAAALQKQNALYRQALRALEAEEQHLARIGTLTARLQEAVTNATEAEAAHAATVAEQATVIEATQGRASELFEQLETTTGKLDTTTHELLETKTQLEAVEAEWTEAQATLSSLNSAKLELETQLEDTSAQLRGAQDELAIATQNIDQLETRQAELSRALDTERLERKNEAAAHEAEVADVRGELASEKKAREKAETQLEKTRADLADERTAHNAVKSELKAETKRADTAEKAQAKAEDALAALREQLATAQAQVKAQAGDLERERDARAQAEQAARTALAAQATAEAQRDARPTQADLQNALADKAKAEAQRDALAERVEQLLKPQAPTPGNDNNGPKA